MPTAHLLGHYADILRVSFPGGFEGLQSVRYPAARLHLGEPACSDGYDNDGDGRVDYPDDPGCLHPDSISEAPACDDGRDNDHDGRTDAAEDPGCHAASDTSEREACGLGFELVLLLPLLHRRRRAAGH